MTKVTGEFQLSLLTNFGELCREGEQVAGLVAKYKSLSFIKNSA